MAVKRQLKFRDTEAQAICETLAILANEDYAVEISHIGKQLGDDKQWYYPFSVIVKDIGSGETVATAQNYHLVDALSDVYCDTPERGAIMAGGSWGG